MEIMYRFYGPWTAVEKKILRDSFGLSLESKDDWAELSINTTKSNPKDLIISGFKKTHRYAVGTNFTKKELDNSPYIIYGSVWTNGYPMEDGDGGYMETTYDNSDLCAECGTGLVQKEPFRLKKKPKWGKKKLFELEWIYDEIFAEKEFYIDALKPLGIGYRDVLLYKDDSVIDNCVQLKIPITNLDINFDKQRFEICSKCNSKKFHPQIEGYFPSFKGDKFPNEPILKSKELYGSGGASNRWIFVSQEIRKLLNENKVKVYSYKALEPVN